MKIFISYGHDMYEPLVSKLAEHIVKRSHTVFKDNAFRQVLEKHDSYSAIIPSSNYVRAIDDAIQECEFFISVLSYHSARPDGFCQMEIARAVEFSKNILPLKVEKVRAPLLLCHIQWIELVVTLDENNQICYDEENCRSVFDSIIEIIEMRKTLERNGGKASLEYRLMQESFDFSKTIATKTRYFVGRKVLLNDIENWVNTSKEKVLLITGSAGMGKTALCSKLSYPIHICNMDNAASLVIDCIFGSLAYQLSMMFSEYAEILCSSPEITTLRNMTPEDIFEFLFVKAANCLHWSDKSNVAIIIDGIDEVPDMHITKILDIIDEFSNELPQWLKIIITSRPEQRILLHPGKKHKININDFEKENEQDGIVYLQERLSAEGIQSTQKDILNIVKKSGGSFLYLYFVVEEAKELADKKLSAKEFPSGISFFYQKWLDNAFAGFNKNLQNKAKIIFEIICSVKSEISVNDLSLVSGISVSDILKIKEHTHSILSINSGGGIKFYHKSVYEWFDNMMKNQSYYVDKKEGCKRIIKYVKACIKNGNDLTYNNYCYKFGILHIIESGNIKLFIDWYKQDIVNTDMLCYPFVHVSKTDAVKFLKQLSVNMNYTDFVFILNTVADYYFDEGMSYVAIDICGAFSNDKNLFIRCNAKLMLAYLHLFRFEKEMALFYADSSIDEPVEKKDDKNSEYKFCLASKYLVQSNIGEIFPDCFDAVSKLNDAKELFDNMKSFKSASLNILLHRNIINCCTSLARYGENDKKVQISDIIIRQIMKAKEALYMSSLFREKINLMISYSRYIDNNIRSGFSENCNMEIINDAYNTVKYLECDYAVLKFRRVKAFLYVLVAHALLNEDPEDAKGLEYLQSALLMVQEFSEDNYTKQCMFEYEGIYARYCMIYKMLDNKEKSIEFGMKAISLLEKINERYRSSDTLFKLAQGYSFVAQMYKDSSDFCACEELLISSVKIYNEVINDYHLWDAYTEIVKNYIYYLDLLRLKNDYVSLKNHIFKPIEAWNAFMREVSEKIAGVESIPYSATEKLKDSIKGIISAFGLIPTKDAVDFYYSQFICLTQFSNEKTLQIILQGIGYMQNKDNKQRLRNLTGLLLSIITPNKNL